VAQGEDTDAIACRSLLIGLAIFIPFIIGLFYWIWS
jgi:hypothetical protein